MERSRGLGECMEGTWGEVGKEVEEEVGREIYERIWVLICGKGSGSRGERRQGSRRYRKIGVARFGF